jgi:hypothetical protein
MMAMPSLQPEKAHKLANAKARMRATMLAPMIQAG